MKIKETVSVIFATHKTKSYFAFDAKDVCRMLQITLLLKECVL